MKQFSRLTLALLLALSLCACQQSTSSAQPAAASAAPASSAASVAEPASEPSGSTQPASSGGQSLPAEEDAEEQAPAAVMTGGENSISVAAGEDVLVEFTLPTETPIYYKLSHSEGNQLATMSHNIMDGVSGGTIVEIFEGTCQDYCEFYKSFVGVPADAAAETKELDGREVLVFKQVEQITNNLGDEVFSFGYLVAVPLREDVTLGFRITGAYNVGGTLVFDDGVIDILLSHCAF